MPEKRYFLGITGAFLAGLGALALSVVLVFALAPFIIPFVSLMLPFLVGAFLVLAAVVIVWAVTYVCIMIGVFVYYIFKPMQVSSRPGTYNIDRVKEAGKRQKGSSRDVKEEEE